MSIYAKRNAKKSRIKTHFSPAPHHDAVFAQLVAEANCLSAAAFSAINSETRVQKVRGRKRLRKDLQPLEQSLDDFTPADLAIVTFLFLFFFVMEPFGWILSLMLVTVVGRALLWLSTRGDHFWISMS